MRLPRGGLPLIPIAPAIVVVVGIATAVAIALLGIAQVERVSDEAAAVRAEVLAAALAARMRSTALEDRSEVLGRAARRSATEILLVHQDGRTLVNESFGAPPAEEVVRMLVAGTGETQTATGRVRFAARPLSPPLEHLSVITFVGAPSPPPGSIALVNAVAALTALLVGVAVAVTLAFMKAVRDDVDFVGRRIVDMASVDADPAGEPIPVRSLDQVGVLTGAFNMLVTRFAAAERSYRADLAQAAVSDAERSAFLNGLSHELRTPLNAILGFAHVLESEVDGPLTLDARESIGIIRTSGEHLRTLIGDILDLSAMETGQLQLVRRDVDVRMVAEQVMREASATLNQKPISLTVSGESGVLAFADKRRVRQILTNLVSNAVKFTSAGSVNVTIEGRGAFAAFIVSDTGPGIAATDRAAIFEEYRQSGDARSRSGGTGLGLAITRRLVAMHGGSIEVQSRVSEGSTFTVTLPIYTGAEVSDIFDPLSVSGGYADSKRLAESNPPSGKVKVSG